MKKFIMLVMSVIYLLSAVTVYAAELPNILKGTPLIDGVDSADSLFHQSCSFTLTSENVTCTSGADCSEAPEFSGTVYLLWDDNYIYVCTTVNDYTISARKPGKSIAFMNDSVEMQISFDGGASFEQFTHKVSHAPIESADGYKSASSAQGHSYTEDMYTVEARFPHGGLSAGSVISYRTQITNALDEDNSKIVCIGTGENACTFTLSEKEAQYNIGSVFAEEAALPTVTAPLQPKPQKGGFHIILFGSAAPQTSDKAVIISLTAAVISLTTAKKIKKK